MMRISTGAAALACLLCLSAVAWALMPPLSPKELKEQSTNIVRGEIADVECTGEFEENRCVSLTGYKATLKVKRMIEGKRYKTLNLFFKKYDFKEGCVGSPDTIHYPGEEALYYLRCKAEDCHLTHWNGIKYKKRGNRSLPECESKRSAVP